MLPGNTPALFGKPPPTYGIDAFTKGLMKFDGVYGAALTGNALTDTIKPSRVWVSGGATELSNGQRFAGTCCYVTGANVISPDPNDPDYQIVPGQDFTVDFWWYPVNTSSGCVLAKESNAGTYSPWEFYQTTGSLAFYSSSNGTAWDIANNLAAGGVTVNVWSHHALQRRGNVWSTWRNGVKHATWTTSANPMSSGLGRVCIGNNWPTSNQPLAGFIDELRFSSCARYDEAASFTPQSFPYYGSLNGSNDAATKLLMHFDGNWTDSAVGAALKTPHVFTASGAAQLTAGGKFGTGAAFFDGANGSCIQTPFTTAVDLCPYSGDFTVDFWMYRTVANTGQIIGPRATGVYGAWIIYDYPDGHLAMYASQNGAAWDIFNGFNFGITPSNQWVHIAVVRCAALSQNFMFYINGSPSASANFPNAILSPLANPFSIGGYVSGPGFIGYLDEVRFSDVARWRAAFTPPTAPYS